MTQAWQPKFTITPAIARGLMAIEATRAVVAETPIFIGGISAVHRRFNGGRIGMTGCAGMIDTPSTTRKPLTLRLPKERIACMVGFNKTRQGYARERILKLAGYFLGGGSV